MNHPRLGATSDSRIKKVAEIIGRDKTDTDFVQGALRDFDRRHQYNAERSPWPPWPVNKREKELARGLAKAFARLERQLQRDDYRAILGPLLYREWDQFHDWKVLLKQWREFLEPSSDAKPGGLFGDVQPARRLGKPKPSAPKYARKHDAVAVAALILRAHGIPSKAGKTSVFCRVAAVVAGDLRIYHQCRVFLKARNRGSN